MGRYARSYVGKRKLNCMPGLRVAETFEEFRGLHPFFAGQLEFGDLQGAVVGGDGQEGLAVGQDRAGRGVQVRTFLRPEDLEGKRSLAALRMTGNQFGEGRRIGA